MRAQENKRINLPKKAEKQLKIALKLGKYHHSSLRKKKIKK